jgi:bifunctional UDP-N-acetylglucosamine pyrophosphorylase / glucosamine-1-phosphate N-acetyltransferase
MSKPSVAAIVLAAGKGTRMKSAVHKVLHPIAGRPMLMHLLASVDALNPTRKVVVVGSGRDQLETALGGTAMLAVQEPQHGTGHAVQQAEAALDGFDGDVLILYGDVPFVPTATMQAMLDRLNAADAPAVVVLAFVAQDPTGYGRVIVEQGLITKMVEQKDASDAEKAVRLCNSGLMAVRARDLFKLLARVTDDNAQKEFYLTDIVNIANSDGQACVTVTTDAFDVAGINSRAQLAQMETAWQARRRQQMMDDGVTLIDPASVFFSFDTQVAADVTIEPNVFFGPGVKVETGVVIHAFSHLEGCTVGKHAEIGPFARLRPGAELHEKVKIGNFVEIKKSVMEKGAKANHLSYIGDAHVGAGANIGAGTITCNYDGFFKYKTEIGAGAFIGSNSSLVAPVKIGDGAIVGAGSVVTKDVEPDALGVTRAEQRSLPGWAAKFRTQMLTKKKKKKKG